MLETLLHSIESNFHEYLIVVLIAVLFFKESIVAFINSKLGRESSPEWSKKTNEKIDRLTQYANHDTTAKLDELIEMEKVSAQNDKEVRDLLKDIGRSLEEIKTYGIKCRSN